MRYTNFASGGNSKELLDVAPDAPNKKIKNGFGFIQRIVSDNLHHILGINKKVSNYKVSFKQGTCSHGWYLEKYEFNRLESGDFSAFVQGGDRWSGGSREFFIPPEYLEGNYEEFLDKYAALVPGDNFGLYKKDLITDNGLKKFLGF